MTDEKAPVNATLVFEGMMQLLFEAVAKESGDRLVHTGDKPQLPPAVARIPETDESALQASLSASMAIAEVLDTLNGIERGIAGKPWPLHSALRTYIKHSKDSLCVAMRDLRGFQALINENGAHE